ncbi:MAG: hypothetical protein GHCLOJNM_03146 [bacterium]|nr:hypothetical protein [bacterium]
MVHATNYTQLRNLSREDLIRLYDESAEHTQIGLDFLRSEIARRDSGEQTESIVLMTKRMLCLTYVIAFMTLVNVICSVICVVK